ncbi:hypothetical protein HDV63DRAFT_382302 [Trichoderma sp. SZMC 28014]
MASSFLLLLLQYQHRSCYYCSTSIAAACGPIHHISGGACICRWDNSCLSSSCRVTEVLRTCQLLSVPNSISYRVRE